MKWGLQKGSCLCRMRKGDVSRALAHCPRAHHMQRGQKRCAAAVPVQHHLLSSGLAVHKLVMLDCFVPMYHPPNLAVQVLRRALVENARLERKDLSKPPSYTEEEVMDIYASSCFNAVPLGYRPENVRTLLQRGWKPSGEEGRYVLNRDARLRSILWQRVDSTAVQEYYTAFTGDLLVLLALSGLRDMTGKRKMLEDVCRQHCRSFRLLELEGSHHMHMNQPDMVAGYIRPFLDPQ